MVLLFQTISLTLIAQKERVRGLYRTSDDFAKGNLSFDNDCSNKNLKIILNDFLSKKFVTVNKDDGTFKLLKGDIFGYRNCNNEIFRFKGKIELLLLNTGEQILIYTHIVSKPPTGRTNVTNYYFSLGIYSLVQELTIKNLKNAFPENLIFNNFIDKNFRLNTDLAAFDKKIKCIKLTCY